MLFGPGGSMTWRNLIHLFLFMVLCMIHPSEEGCKDYFVVEKLKVNATDIIPIVRPKDSKDILYCTVERMCLENQTWCSILFGCFKKQSPTASEKCQGNTSHSVPRFHLMCLLAHVFNVTTPACEYVTTCEMYSQKSSAAPTAATTVTPATTSAAATSTSPPAATTNPELLASRDWNGEFPQIFCKISAILNIFWVIGIIVYCMRRPRPPNSEQTGTPNSSEVESENQLMMRAIPNSAITLRKKSEEESSNES